MGRISDGKSMSLDFQTPTSTPLLKPPALPSSSFRAVLSTRGPCSQNSESIAKPKSVPEFSTPQFPICLMGIITPTHFTETLALQQHLDAMVTGDITPTHAPPRWLHYSAEMQTDQQLGQRKPHLTPDEGWPTAFGKPQFCS